MNDNINLDEPAGAGPDSRIRQRAKAALRQGQFDLIERGMTNGDFSLADIMEDVHVYQAELEIQNEEMRSSRLRTDIALTRFRTLFYGVPLPVMVIDPHGIITDANSHAASLFGLELRHLRQRFFLRQIRPHDKSRVAGALTQANTEGVRVCARVAFETSNDTVAVGNRHIAQIPGNQPGEWEYVCAVTLLPTSCGHAETHPRLAPADARGALRAATALAENAEAIPPLFDRLVALAPISFVDMGVPPAGAPGERDTGCRHESATVLLIAAGAAAQLTTAAWLRQRGLQVDWTADAGDAFEMLRRANYDLVLLDSDPARGPDVALAERLRRHEARVPIVVLPGEGAGEKDVPPSFAALSAALCRWLPAT